MNKSGKPWESNTQYNLIKKRTIETIHFEYYCYARDG